MNRFSFKNDYAEGCHANILKALVETNREQQIGYGGDQYSAIARDMIKERFNSPKQMFTLFPEVHKQTFLRFLQY